MIGGRVFWESTGQRKSAVVAAGVLTLALLLLHLAGAATALAAQPDNGTIEGMVFNGTRDIAVANQELKLAIYLNDSETGSRKATTGDDGRFTFSGLATGKGYSYDVTVNYQEADYTSESVSFEDGATTKSIKITVYDSTATDEAIRVLNAHAVIYAEPGSLLVKQYAVFDNEGKLTFVGSKEIALGKKETLRFYIPKEATDKQYGLSLMQCCVYPGDETVSDIMVVLPGTKEVAYSYQIPSPSETCSFTQKFIYPTDRYDLLVQNGITVSGGGLTREEPVNIQGQQFSRYSLQDAGAGQLLEIQLSGLPQDAAQRNTRLIAIGMAAVALLAVPGYLLARRRRKQPLPVAGEAPDTEKESLLIEIARLDDAFETGEMGEGDYLEQRAEKKRRLLELMRH